MNNVKANDKIIATVFNLFEKFSGRVKMATSYKKLWHILLDRNVKKKELQAKANLTQYQMNKLARGENVTTDIIGRICAALDVKADDILDFIPDEVHTGD